MKKEYIKPIIEVVALPTQGTLFTVTSPKTDEIEIYDDEEEDDTVDDFGDLL